ncbi:MAG: biotin carboxylase [Candidatus Tectomicrobia bacterium]|uniref:Biotin carboxylase n=1 Tax=Tectimicrobiota bacterium TaxID=2528274 RepID=A0A933GLX2_UNCTE|nr:biotin carboxylase [Candidatus Tectomicrobia bacterium]
MREEIRESPTESSAVERADVNEVRRLRAARLDANRPEAVEKRHRTGHWTARENIDAFVDPGSFLEYGALAKPLVKGMSGPADGTIIGTARVNGQSCAVLAYDYTVHAGTGGHIGYLKHERIFQLARKMRLPVICWLEGGGHRPHDLKVGMGLDLPCFYTFAELSGWVPLVGIVAGRCFAGNTNLAGMCDVIIATPKSTIGMAGPAMIEPGLGRKVAPEEIGPLSVQVPNGVVDLVAEDDGQAIALAKQYVSYFDGQITPGKAPDASCLPTLVPESPRQAYDVRRVIEHIGDVDSILELRPKFGKAMVTALMRIEGYPVGVVANNPMVLSGAIDSSASDKASRFIQLCDAFDIPILFLCDTPGLMVGPEAEETAIVRHSSRLLVNLASTTVPKLTVILRKFYGMGGFLMGSKLIKPHLIVGWPTAEWGVMGPEGAVNIMFKDELNAVPDAESRQRLRFELIKDLNSRYSGIEVAGKFEIDDIIDPVDTRHYLAQTLASLPKPPARTTRKRMIDPW